MRVRTWQVAIGGLALLVTAPHVLARPDTERPELPTRSPPGAAHDQLIIEPDAGMQPIDALLGSAHRSLDLTMYELVDPTAEALLADAASRGVRVRVVLDHRLEGRRNTPAYLFLRSRGVDVRWSSPRFFATHEKAFVIDDRVAVMMSLNLTDRYYATSRDLAVVDRDPADIAAIESVFASDFSGREVGTPAADDLVWSPGQSEADLVALVDQAHQSIAVESEELTSEAVVRALLAALQRGVQVSIAMTDNSAARPALQRLAAAGGRVAMLYGEAPLYIHAKLLAIDAGTAAARAFVGSENFSDASLRHDRELGIVLIRPEFVNQVAATIAADVSSGQPLR